jgi:hypothetical protein
MMRTAERPTVTWHVEPGAPIPTDVADAAVRGVPIVAHVHNDAAIDGWAAELLESCSAVVRYGV